MQYLIDRLRDSDELESALLQPNNSGDTPFLAGASRGNRKACECLLRAADGAPTPTTGATMLRTANGAGDTPLKVAVASSQGEDGEDTVAFLLKADDGIPRDPFGRSGTAAGDDPMSRTCVDRENGSGLSPLIVACERNLPAVADLLLQHGADVDVRDPKGRNPLAIAAFCGCNDALQFLLDRASTTALLLNRRDGGGCTPVWLAARTGNLSVVELLMDAGADATIKDDAGLSPHDVAAKFKKEKVEQYFAKRTESQSC